jgi:large repetitive protein
MRTRQPIFVLAVLLAACQQGGGERHTATPERSAKLVRAADPIAGQYLVLLAEGVSEIGARALAARHDATVLRYLPAPANTLLVALSPSRAVALAEDAAVRLAEEDSRVRIASAEWGLDRVDQRAAEPRGAYQAPNAGAGVHVYVVDTDVVVGHAELAGRADAPASFADVPPTGECNGHGTHLAAVAAGATVGVAPAATVHAVRAVDCDGVGAVSSIVAALDWIREHHTSPAVALVGVTSGLSPALDEALRDAIDAGVTIVAPAGNDAVDACGRLPAAVPGVLAAGATTWQDEVLDPSAQGACVDLFAPGTEVRSAWSDGGYRFATGTSQAAAHVAGAAALFLSAHPTASPAMVADALTGNATLGVLSRVVEPSPNRLLYVGFVSAEEDTAAPEVAIAQPSGTAPVSGEVLVSVTTTATDVSQVAVFVDGRYVGADADGDHGWTVAWRTARWGNGSHLMTARAYDAAGNVGEAESTVTVSNPGNAAYDAELKVPACHEGGARCASGDLLLGRGLAGPEQNAPNTIRALCADGAAGVYLRDESIERVEVSAASGAALAEGGWVDVKVVVNPYPDFATDEVDLWFARDAGAPEWEYLATRGIERAGLQEVSFGYRLPAFPDEPKGALQAVRATIRYGGARAACSDGPYDDHDDLAFAVDAGAADEAAPVVTLAAIRDGAEVGEGGEVSGVVPLAATVLEAGGGAVTRVEFFTGDTEIGTAFASSGGVWRLDWNADRAPTGDTVLHAFAYDSSGNAGRSEDVKVKVADLSNPTVTIERPLPDAVVGGIVRIEADAKDNRGVTKVEFFGNGESIGTATTPPWAVSWDTAELTGPATVVAKASDAAGRSTTSAAIALEIDNEVPTVAIVAPVAGEVVPEAYEISIDAQDDRGLAAVDFYAAGAYVGAAGWNASLSRWTLAWRTAGVPNGATRIQARARDLAGNIEWSAEVPVEVKDAMSPEVAITAPASGALVRGVVPISANATDAGLVAEVEFRAGEAVVDVDRFPPYEAGWNTTAFADGPLDLTAIARDTAANEGQAMVRVTVDNHGPDTWVLPLANAPAHGTVLVKVHAADPYAVDRVELWVDDALLGPASAIGGELDTYGASWVTTEFDNGPHALRAVAYDRAGNVTTSAVLTAFVANVTTASFDPALRVPACTEAAAWCASGTLLARAGPAEANGPNTLDACADGPDSVPGETESIEAIRVEAEQGALEANAPVKVHVRYFAYAADAGDQLDVYHAADANNPAWELVGTLTPVASGLDEQSLVLVLPTGPRQAIRANMRFAQPGPSPCNGGAYGDRDDLVFAVGTPSDASAPSIALLGPVNGGIVGGDVFVETEVTDDEGVARVDLYVDDLRVDTRTRPEPGSSSRYTAIWDAGGAVAGPHRLEIRAADTSGNSATTNSFAVTVRNLPTAAWDAGLEVPACLGVDSFCDAAGLLAGRAEIVGGSEVNAPNTLAGSCEDGVNGVYGEDESLEWLKVTSVDGLPLEAGKRARVEARVVAYSGWSDDALDLYVTSTPDDPHWIHFATLKPQGPGMQSLRAELQLPPSAFQAIRGRFRYGGAEGACGAGPDDDHDDVAFAVEYTPNAAYDARLSVPACASAADHCDSGALLDGRGPLGPEKHAPNTLGGTCSDGTLGTYHEASSVDAVLVRTPDGTPLRAGGTARVEVQVWASTASQDERVDLFISGNPEAASPSWQRVAALYPTRSGAQVLIGDVTLPTSGRVAIRAHTSMRTWWTLPLACGTAADTNRIDDQDDLVFVVSP